MAINFAPQVGEVLQCDFGVVPTTFPVDASGKQVIAPVDAVMPPEMVKNRLVIVLSSEIKSCIVVPLSSKFDAKKTRTGRHVEIATGIIPGLYYFTDITRWAKGDMVQQVSNLRLNSLMGPHNRLTFCLDRATVELVQRAVVKSISAGSLLKSPVPNAAPQAATPVPAPAPATAMAQALAKAVAAAGSSDPTKT